MYDIDLKVLQLALSNNDKGNYFEVDLPASLIGGKGWLLVGRDVVFSELGTLIG